MVGVGGVAFMLLTCLYEANAVEPNTNYTVTIKDTAEDIEFTEGGDVTIKCEVILEEDLKRHLIVKWFHQENELTDLPRQQPVFGGQGGEFTEDIVDTFEGSALCGGEEDCSENKVLLADNSLKITSMKLDDVGDYRCEAFMASSQDGRSEMKASSRVTSIYQPSPFPWWIIVVVVVIVILIVISVLFYLKYKKGWNIKGYYDVNDIENSGVRSDKSDVYYKAETVTSDGKVTYNQQESTLMEE